MLRTVNSIKLQGIHFYIIDINFSGNQGVNEFSTRGLSIQNCSQTIQGVNILFKIFAAKFQTNKNKKLKKVSWSPDGQAWIGEAEPPSDTYDMLSMGAYENFQRQSFQYSKPIGIFAIKKSEGHYWTEKPILRTEISDIIYDFTNMNKKTSASRIDQVELENYSHIPQVVTRRGLKCTVLSFNLRNL